MSMDSIQPGRMAIALLLMGLVSAPALAATPAPAAKPTSANAPIGGQQSADPNATPFHVSFVTVTTVYVNAGRDDGLAAGDSLQVVRNGRAVATLVVTDLASHRAACSIDSSSSDISIGDAVRSVQPLRAATPTASNAEGFTEVSAPTLAPSSMTSVTRLRQMSWLRSMGLRGRLGARFLGVRDRSGLGENLTQPALDARLDGTRIGGSRFDMKADVRTRHTFQTMPDGSGTDNGRTRVYRLSATYRTPGDHFALSVGRQFSAALATVSTFDGVEAEFDSRHFGLGLFTGTQPEPVNYGYSTEIREHGAFMRLHSAPRAPLRWETVVAGIGSYQQGQLNREYVALLSSISSARTSVMLQQEIDFNRGWKVDVGEPRQSLTSTFASARYRLVGGLDLDAGLDNRRNVRLYRDYITPETEFDDTYRQGIWGGSNLRFARRFRVGASVRNNSGGSAGTSTSYIFNASANRLTSLRAQVRLRSTRYTNERTSGWMHTISSGMSITPTWFAELSGGTRQERALSEGTAAANATWYGFNIDVGLGPSWYMSVSAERDERGDESYDQVFSSLSYRF